MSPQEQYEVYRQNRVAHQAEEAKMQAERLVERQKTAAFYEGKKKPPHVVTCRKPHTCNNCKTVIPAGAKATVQTVPYCHRVYAEGYTTIYLCKSCRPIEAKKP